MEPLTIRISNEELTLTAEQRLAGRKQFLAEMNRLLEYSGRMLEFADKYIALGHPEHANDVIEKAREAYAERIPALKARADALGEQPVVEDCHFFIAARRVPPLEEMDISRQGDGHFKVLKTPKPSHLEFVGGSTLAEARVRTLAEACARLGISEQNAIIRRARLEVPGDDMLDGLLVAVVQAEE